MTITDLYRNSFLLCISWMFLFIPLHAIEPKKELHLLFVGDSLTAGYQIKQEEAFPFLLQQKIKNELKKVAKVIDASVSGATSLEALSRMDYFLETMPDVMILAIGPNDGLRGLNLTDTEINIQRMIEKAQAKKIKILLVGLKLPTNYGPKYRQEFESLYSGLAQKNKIALVPFLLEGVAGIKEFNLPDGIHPNPQGHIKMCENIWKHLRPLL